MIFNFRNSTQEQNEKLERLYSSYRQRLYYVALKILQEPADAEDAVQDAFLRIRDHLDQISEENGHKTTSFLVVVVRHIAIDYLRKRKKEVSYSMEALDRLVRLETEEPQALGSDLEEAFQQLSFDHAEILRLKYYQDFSNAEIAGILGISESSVRKRLSRARKKLEELTAEGNEHEVKNG